MPPTPECPPASQPVHSDADFQHPDHPFALVINVPLITMTPENGSTEVWLGTHQGSNLHAQEGLHGERASGRIKEDELEKQRAIRPPCQPVVPKGSIILRDLRLWHAGIGNQTDTVRVMLAMSMSTAVNTLSVFVLCRLTRISSSFCAVVSESNEIAIL